MHKGGDLTRAAGGPGRRRSRPTGTSARLRLTRRCHRLVQRGGPLEPIGPPLRPMGYLADVAEHDETLEETGRVLGHHPERFSERGGGDEGAAARMSTAAAACESRRLPATAAHGAGHWRSRRARPSSASATSAARKCPVQASSPKACPPAVPGRRSTAGRAGRSPDAAANIAQEPRAAAAARRPDRARHGPRGPRRAAATARCRPSRDGRPRPRWPGAGSRPARQTTGRAQRRGAPRRTICRGRSMPAYDRGASGPPRSVRPGARVRSPCRRPQLAGRSHPAGRARPRPVAMGGRRAPYRGGRSCRRHVRERRRAPSGGGEGGLRCQASGSMVRSKQQRIEFADRSLLSAWAGLSV